VTSLPQSAATVEPTVPAETLLGLFRRFLRFGFLAWGGPIAQIAMLRRELVDTERWISSDRFNRTLAVYQALPGPEAHELCVYFGYLARGRIGGLLAGVGFMLPGLALMLLLSWLYVGIGLESPIALAFFAGAQAAVLALIVRGVHRIGRHAVTDRWLVFAALLAAGAAIAGVHFVIILGATGVSYLLASRGRAALAAGFLAGLVIVSGLGVVAHADDDSVGRAPEQDNTNPRLATAGPGELLASGLKAGLLTFGGAYTAIPFLQSDIEQGGWMTRETFLDGVALGGILPAPLIIFSTFVGYVAGGLPGAVAITAGIFFPAFAITIVGHRQLERLVHHGPTHAVLDGVTAGVVGLVAATAITLGPTALGSLAGTLIFAASLGGLYAWRSGLAIPVAVLAAGAAGALLFEVLGLRAA
jgi:chromate transporter